MWQKFLSKLLSGRWIFTVICAIAFLYCVIARIFAPVDIKEIVMIIIVFYFQRNDRGKQDNGPVK